MYEDSNKDKVNMIGACLILYHDINDEKATKRMTIANPNINEKSKSAPSNTYFFPNLPLYLLSSNQIKQF